MAKPGAVPCEVTEYFTDNSVGLAAYREVVKMLGGSRLDVRVSKSQVAFRRKRGFAYLWLPGRYLHGSHAPVVLSIVLDRRDRSPRFKEVVHPSPKHWMHHLEIYDPEDLDDEVAGWVREAAELAG